MNYQTDSQEICNDVPSIYQIGKSFPPRSVWLPFVMQSPKTLYAALTVGATLIHYLQGNHSENPPILYELRSKAVAAINESLDDPTGQVNAANVLAVALMTVVESLGGDLVAYEFVAFSLLLIGSVASAMKFAPSESKLIEKNQC